METLSNTVRLLYEQAVVEARNMDSRAIEPEHLCLALFKMPEIIALPDDHEIYRKIKRTELEGEMAAITVIWKQRGFAPAEARTMLRRLLKYHLEEESGFQAQRSQRCETAFQLAMELGQAVNSGEIRCGDLLNALLLQESAALDDLLDAMRVERCDLMTCPEMRVHSPEMLQPELPLVIHTPTPVLDSCSRDITIMASRGQLPPLIGRRQEILKMARALVQHKKSSLILVGEPGVGKTCLVEGLASLIESADVPALLYGHRIVELNLGAVVAGTKYRGEFEDKLRQILDEAAEDPYLVLFIDEIHTIIRAGDSEGGLTAGNILKPALSRGTLKLIGATTTREYRRFLSRDTAIQRRFQLIWVEEPGLDESVEILRGLVPGFHEHYNLEIPEQLVSKAVELSQRHLPDLRLPDKAIDLLDQSCAAATIRSLSTARQEPVSTLPLEIMQAVLSERCQIPLEELSEEEGARLLRMEDYIKRRVKGQDQAISRICRSLRAARLRLTNRERPCVFFLAGPTGVGKTELARALAAFLFHDEKHLLRFDMSEYKEKHSLARLIGSPPGYAGYDDEGQLTGAVRNRPFCVLLFDEIDKAHPHVYDLFLQILDAGRLTDGQGRLVSFSECIIIFTSNAGSDRFPGHCQGSHAVGFVPSPDDSRQAAGKARVLEAVQELFRPEFVNRLENIIIFNELSLEAVEEILDKIVAGVNLLLADKKIHLVLDAKARSYIINQGYSPKFGARELERTFTRLVTEPLAASILKRTVLTQQMVKVALEDERISLKPCCCMAV